MANSYICESNPSFLVVKMTWKEYTAITGSWYLCDCCGEAITTEGYYVCAINSFYCENCFKAYISGARHKEVDKEKERASYNSVISKLKDLDVWNG